MYAIVQDGSKQVRVSEGEEVVFDRKPGDPGNKIEFDTVLLLHDGKKATVGAPKVEGAKVVGEIISQVAGPKLRVFKYRRREGTQRMLGHKQKYTLLKITNIKAK